MFKKKNLPGMPPKKISPTEFHLSVKAALSDRFSSMKTTILSPEVFSAKLCQRASQRPPCMAVWAEFCFVAMLIWIIYELHLKQKSKILNVMFRRITSDNSKISYLLYLIKNILWSYQFSNENYFSPLIFRLPWLLIR